MEQKGRSEAPHRGQVAAERRAHPRYRDELRVRFRDIEGADAAAWGCSRDLSLGGMCLLSDAEVALGSHLALEIHVEGQTAPVLALGRVVRCHVMPRGGHSAGIQFVWVGAEDRANLQRLAEYFRQRHGAG